ncbi:hypothetical protein BDV27DRAFT_3561 [Aspergillus caelatus]|uniref:Uncharacterized protein n=1 Tax=Aspergillus caelatus TaxID=61420 RepID=A0A5N7A5M2_9EURO|nr:uncharacterized protein BDV27DRAFT_3561 [Aspergillus caelatus]KAE8363820.1 hypothetical protein BDV27DRAFT_3561 [Aspergillus caelatus]
MLQSGFSQASVRLQSGFISDRRGNRVLGVHGSVVRPFLTNNQLVEMHQDRESGSPHPDHPKCISTPVTGAVEDISSSIIYNRPSESIDHPLHVS